VHSGRIRGNKTKLELSKVWLDIKEKKLQPECGLMLAQVAHTGCWIAIMEIFKTEQDKA